MLLTQTHTTKTVKTAKQPSLFMRWATARCPHCGLPMNDWMPISVPGPVERMSTQREKQK